MIAITIISLSLYKQYSKSLIEQSSEKAQQILELSAMNIESYIDDLYRLSLSPYYDHNVIDALDKSIDDSDLISLYRTRTIEDFLDQILITPRQDILRVFILTDEIYKGERMPSTIDSSQIYQDYDWYKKAMATEEPLLVSAHLEQIIKNPKNIVFSIVRVIRSTRNTDRILGVIKVDANYSSIKSLCDQPDFGDEGGLFIMDSDNQLIHSNIIGFDGDAYNTIYQTIQDGTINPTGTIINDKQYLINYVTIKDTNWTMVGITSYNTINHGILIVRRSANFIALMCFLVSLLIIILYLYRFLHPLNSIISTIKKIQGGHLDVVFNTSSKDELAYLSYALNDMITELKNMFSQNNQLVHQIYEAKYLQKEAQISSLFSQIQPHFIYNTLNMISILIQTEQFDEAVSNINKLSIMLRGLSHIEKDITIQTEIELLDAYLSIQKSRYVDRLDYKIDIDHKLYNFLIPALSLQPIAENSVIHGCETKKTITTISITSIKSENHILIIIKDNGIGMTPETLTTLQDKLKNGAEINNELNTSEKSSGIALLNVHRRIQIKYGERYGIKVNSTLDVGTTVELYLPMQIG
ncbi:MAG: cache domain-containing protein [Vallitaleaceae bacterium]|nr:cache domain-containing protein [Vallitaleaceae bacterium]